MSNDDTPPAAHRLRRGHRPVIIPGAHLVSRWNLEPAVAWIVDALVIHPDAVTIPSRALGGTIVAVLQGPSGDSVRWTARIEYEAAGGRRRVLAHEHPLDRSERPKLTDPSVLASMVGAARRELMTDDRHAVRDQAVLRLHERCFLPREIAKLLGLTALRVRVALHTGRIEPPTTRRWTEQAIARELERLLTGATRLPEEVDLEAARDGLLDAIRGAGGLVHWARRCGSLLHRADPRLALGPERR